MQQATNMQRWLRRRGYRSRQSSGRHSSPSVLQTSSRYFGIGLFLLIVIYCGLSSTTPIVLVQASQAAGTETLVGIVGKDFVLLLADSSMSSGATLTASNLDKIATIADPFPQNDSASAYDDNEEERRNNNNNNMAILAAAAGNAADSGRLIEKLKNQATIEEYTNGWGLDVKKVIMPPSSSASTRLDSESRMKFIMPQEAPGLDVKAVAHCARRMISESLRSREPFNVCLLIAGMMLVNDDNNSVNKNRSLYDEPIIALQEEGTDVVSVTGTSSGGKTRGTVFASQMLQQQVRQASGSQASDESARDLSTNLSRQRSSLYYQPRLYWLDEYGSLQQVQYGAHGYAATFLLSILDRGYKSDMTLEEATALIKECFSELRSRYTINSPQPPCIKCISSNGIRLIQP